MAESLVWERDGPRWPWSSMSRFVQAGGLRWHVQTMGSGPVALLIHGTGASTHSWRDLMPLLASRFTVVAMDLPGHAFTGTPSVAQHSLPEMAALLGALVEALALDVRLILGHSAGAAIGARAILDGRLRPDALVSINGAMLPLPGLPGLLFPPAARLLAATPLVSQLFSRRNWNDASVSRLINGTGSRIDQEGLALYAALMRDPSHTAGALAMMSRWDLGPLGRDLARLRTPLVALVGAADRAVDPADSRRVCALLPASTPRSMVSVADAGHLVHEERPKAVADLINAALAALNSQARDHDVGGRMNQGVTESSSS